jgi:Clp amino terminal domain, pathogenicity island component
MFERFTDRARRVVVLAQEEARMLNHDRVGSEHLLLGLARERDGVAARALTSLGITEAAVRQRVEEVVGRGKRPPPAAPIPFTSPAKKAMELSMREAMQLGHSYIGTEHLLLGLIRQGEGPATEALARLGAEPAAVRRQVIELLHGEGRGRGPTGPRWARARPAARTGSCLRFSAGSTRWSRGCPPSNSASAPARTCGHSTRRSRGPAAARSRPSRRRTSGPPERCATRNGSCPTARRTGRRNGQPRTGTCRP